MATSCDVQAPPLTPSELQQCRVAALGDSLTVGVTPYLSEALRSRDCSLAWIEAEVGWRTPRGIDALAQRALNDEVPAVLIVGLGTNDGSQVNQLGERVDHVMRIANGRHVIWIDNAHLPIRTQVNTILADRARRHPNLTIMSWNEPYWDTPQWRARDGIHATAAGYQARANLMAASAAGVVK